MIGATPAGPSEEDRELVRRFEPVLRYTAGELFFPMSADAYLAGSSLWRARPNSPPEMLVGHGDLTPERLVQTPEGGRLFLRYAPTTLNRKELSAWRRRPDRPRFAGVSRMAAVGLLGRVIDSGMRLSLTMRGKVPGGLTAAAQLQYATTDPAQDAYHAKVSHDGGYTVVQYWYLYAMNDWRSSFSGVNDHESDWEQVTLYLTDDGHGGHELAWLAFSSHDETGDELRRRADDPDIAWVGTHPVVNAGAGSHSGAYLPGDYLVRVQPPALARLFGVLTRIRSALFPWTRNQPSLGVGIPYIDYRRGDGVRIGPGTDRPWTAILIDDDTPWVRDYRGLWGLDTQDPFGGERAPAGPRYERNGAIRMAWADPVGWAGLDKVPPTARDRRNAAEERLGELDKLIHDLDAQIADGQDELRRAAVQGTKDRITAQQQAVNAVRVRRREAVNERDRVRLAPDRPAGPHDHLRHRAMPDTATPTNALLRFWSGASLSILLILLGLALLFNLAGVPLILIGTVAIVMGIEAVLRGRLALFLLGAAILVALAALIWLFFTHLRIAFGVLALIAAIAIGVANLRNTFTQR